MPARSRAPHAHTKSGSPENAETSTSTAASMSDSTSKRVLTLLTPALYLESDQAR